MGKFRQVKERSPIRVELVEDYLDGSHLYRCDCYKYGKVARTPSIAIEDGMFLSNKKLLPDCGCGIGQQLTEKDIKKLKAA